MAVKDDPNSHIKVEDAKRAYHGPVPEMLEALCQTQGYKALVAFRFNGRGDARIDYRVPDDERGSAILGEWSSQTLRAAGVPWFEGCVMLGVRHDGWLDTATWGINTEACAKMANWRNHILERDVTTAPFQTWFGWGNEGLPKRLAPAAYAALTPRQQEWADAHTHPQAD